MYIRFCISMHCTHSRYLIGRSSNMAIIDVEIPSGYIYTGWKYANDFVSDRMLKQPHHVHCIIWDDTVDVVCFSPALVLPCNNILIRF